VRREEFVPLVHRPGEAQVDFGHALAKAGGNLEKIVFFVMRLPHSDAVHVQAFPRICTEALWEGHVRALRFFGRCAPWRITCDNDRTLEALAHSAAEASSPGVRAAGKVGLELLRRIRSGIDPSHGLEEKKYGRDWQAFGNMAEDREQVIEAIVAIHNAE